MSLLRLTPHDWEYAAAGDAPADHPGDFTSWTPCTRFPTEIHDELRTAGKIPDWNKGRHEHDVQWVSKQSWKFRAQIDVDLKSLGNAQQGELVFEGIDTFASVQLNGKHILDADNHFRTWRVPISTSQLQASNELLFTFTPPQGVATAVAKEHGPFRGGSCNLGDRARMGIRKAQYHARWDWGPELWCIGVDRPVYLDLFTSRIKSVDTSARVDEKLRTSLGVTVETEGSAKDVKVTIKAPDGTVLKEESLNGLSGEWDVDAELWWPVNEGKQMLYEVKVELYESGHVVDSLTRKIGFRRVELIQQPLDGQPGTSFFFRINNKPIFMGGSNWIPIDCVLSTGTRERYERWLDLMVEGGQNMIRVWGGGVYETDTFYEMCDEKGLLVWQDFMFACGVYPVFPEFMASVEAEARDNIARLRHHPALVMLCGNNEDYQVILQWDIDQSGDPLPARKIYEKLLPDLIKELVHPHIPYWPGSPYGGDNWNTGDPTVGDVHQWDVWGGKELSYLDWDRLGGRFVSEFGLPALPDHRTIKYWLDGDDSQAWPQSKLMQQHNKAGSHERRFAILMNENFRLTGDLTEYAFRNQLMQSEGVGEAYRTWRRQWKGPNKEYCGGTLVWQLNDCWPVTSWAIVDYFYRPKPTYYAIARAMKPVSLGVLRRVEKNRENDRPRQYYEFGAFQSRRVTAEVWASNGAEDRSVRFRLQAFDIMSGWTKDIVSQTVVLKGNQSTELWSGDIPEPDTPLDRAAPTATVILHVNLEDQNGHVAQYDDWPQPYKFLDLPDPEITMNVEADTVVLRCSKPAKGVWLDVEGSDDGVKWGNNSIDMCPGEAYRVPAQGVKGRVITYSSLGWEKPRVASIKG